MLITKTSMISGITRTLDIPVTEEQVTLWSFGALIQDVMPQLSDAEREFVMTGITQEEWAKFAEECDEGP